jgi:hypothetical protein
MTGQTLAVMSELDGSATAAADLLALTAQNPIDVGWPMIAVAVLADRVLAEPGRIRMEPAQTCH